MNYYEEIPNNWEEIILENISLRIHYGFTASSIKKNTGTKLLRITDIQNYKVDWNSVPFCKIEPQDINKYILKEGDILFARTGATVGKSFLIYGKIPEAVFASYLIRINLSSYINAKYLYYFFQSADYWKQINNKSIGTGQPNVNGISLSNLNLLLAPINEQTRIVSKIEELFSELDSLEANLQKIQKKIKIYKESILSNTLLNAKNSNVISHVKENGAMYGGNKMAHNPTAFIHCPRIKTQNKDLPLWRKTEEIISLSMYFKKVVNEPKKKKLSFTVK
ncbi:hypothetical protein ASE21_19375 [Flavobacterium sp. Root901]|uniref:restriction endonuclease subunit S n=1 Tax=Flavobacterium sp. Root901 TaxID=1736605 RepID=UPI000710C6E0|nr:restriction endonuclease subunit S [Flavobacterium sp. Root901]KRD06334.1 hypothetical protein ASE21_19375 [Flavobacterium sp. Root901]